MPTHAPPSPPRPSPPGPAAPLPQTQRGFLASLFDFSFTSLVTTRIIKVLYVLAMIGIGLFALIFVIAAFKANGGVGLLTLLVIAPFGALVYLVYTRVFLEMLIALFRIMENTSELVAQGRRAASGPDDARLGGESA